MEEKEGICKRIIKVAYFFNMGSVYQCSSIKTFIILPALILQKPSAKCKKAEHTFLLKNGWICVDIISAPTREKNSSS